MQIRMPIHILTHCILQITCFILHVSKNILHIHKITQIFVYQSTYLNNSKYPCSKIWLDWFSALLHD